MTGLAGADSTASNATATTAKLAAENNFLKHVQADALQKEFDQCNKKPGGCSDADYIGIRNKYLALSNQNTAQVEACKFSGNVECVKNLEKDAASAGEISTQLIGANITTLYVRIPV